MAKLKKTKKADTAATKIDLEALAKNFNSLDPQNMGTWPLVVKVTIAAFILGLILLLAYLVPIKNKMGEIDAAKKEQVTLLEQFKEKEGKARNLNDYKQQIVQMESTFAQLLNQLPKDTRIPELVEDINMRGVSSGVQFRDISVKPEVTRELFIEQPITIDSRGDYHEFGRFVSGIANLSRIITMHDFTLENVANDKLDELPELAMTINASTYRSKDAEEQAAEKEKKEGKK